MIGIHKLFIVRGDIFIVKWLAGDKAGTFQVSKDVLTRNS